MNVPCETASRLAVLGTAVGLLISLRMAPVARADGTLEADRDVHNLVLLAPDYPIFIQIRVQVDGQGLKSVRTAYAAQIVKNYDKDGDGLLDREEAKSVPPLVKSPTTRDTVAISERWEAVDVNPADDKVSVEELAGYIDRVFGSPFELSVKPQRATQGVDLFSLLDLNHDGRLSHEELAAAAKTLRKLDLDEDETFTIDELQPFRSPQIPQVPAVRSSQVAEQPFLSLDDISSLPKVADQLLQRYATTGTGGARMVLTPDSLHLPGVAPGALDVDGDGQLSAAELAAFLKNPTPHLVLDAQLLQRTPGRPKLLAVEDPLHAVTADKKARTADKLALSIGSVALQMQIITNRSNLADSRSLIKTTKFKSADADKNNYLSEQEFGALGLPDADFKSVDRNGDGMVVLDEVLAYIDQESASSQSRIEMTISHDGKSVFEILDSNHDRRLSRRELANAVKSLRGSDLNGDGAITAVELAGRFKVELGLGKPVLFRNLGTTPRGDTTAPVISAPSAGPDWFRKMDRNRDGDVSLHEFLGPPAAFKKLDTDGDGLITAEEANQASPSDARESAP